MREVEFRGRTKENKWVYGYYWVEECRNKNAHHIYTFEKIGDTDLIRITGNFEVDTSTVNQYTERKEKDTQICVEGEKLFYGDIVRCFTGEYYQGVYEYDCTFAIKSIYDLVNIDNCENVQKLGNIYDNPELLEG